MGSYSACWYVFSSLKSLDYKCKANKPRISPNDTGSLLNSIKLSFDKITQGSISVVKDSSMYRHYGQIINF